MHGGMIASDRVRAARTFPDVLRQHLIDERLIAHTSAPGLPAKLLEYVDIDTNRDQLAADIA